MRLVTLLILVALAIITVAAFAQGLCGPGFFSADGSAPCEACPPGTFSPTEGAVSCQLCPLGTYAAAAGSAQCNACPEGTIAPFLGSAQCQPCPEGTVPNAGRTECVTPPVPARPTSWGLLKSRYGTTTS